MENHSPQNEFFPYPSGSPLPDINQSHWFRSQRLIIFVIVFLVGATAGLAYTYSSPAIYSSTATLLTLVMTSIDQEATVADIQHVAIQKQILLGDEVVSETLVRLKSAAVNNALFLLAPSYIRCLLDVVPVNETNLVEARAEG